MIAYTGTLILISHDRAFIDQVVTSVLVFEGEGRIIEHLGGYSDYQAYLKQKEKAKSEVKKEPTTSQKRETTRAVKHSYNEQRELERLPLEIETLEQEIAALQAKTLLPDFYQQSPDALKAFHQNQSEKEEKLATLYARWEHLEGG